MTSSIPARTAGRSVGGDVVRRREPAPGRGRRPGEGAVERPLSDDERAVGREVRPGDPREAQRVVDPQAVVDPGRLVGARDERR